MPGAWASSGAFDHVAVGDCVHIVSRHMIPGVLPPLGFSSWGLSGWSEIPTDTAGCRCTCVSEAAISVLLCVWERTRSSKGCVYMYVCVCYFCSWRSSCRTFPSFLPVLLALPDSLPPSKVPDHCFSIRKALLGIWVHIILAFWVFIKWSYGCTDRMHYNDIIYLPEVSLLGIWHHLRFMIVSAVPQMNWWILKAPGGSSIW